MSSPSISASRWRRASSCSIRHRRTRRVCLPDVRAAGFTQVLPLQNWGWNSVSTGFVVKGAPARNEPAFPIELRYVSPGYFEALGIPIRRGRGVAVRRHEERAAGDSD